MKLCTYIVRSDAGLAPNPFWGRCTLAVCTPNHQNARLIAGDWIAGFLGKERQHRLLYAMEIDEVLDMGDYFYDPRFQRKKPKLGKNWKVGCGDNFYERKDGEWIQHAIQFHVGHEHLQKDTKHPKVFISSRYWYFGTTAQQVPPRMLDLAGGRGIRVNHSLELVAGFLAWLKRFSPGVNGDPNDNPDLNSADDPHCWRVEASFVRPRNHRPDAACSRPKTLSQSRSSICVLE